jgi:hypothetical protein
MRALFAVFAAVVATGVHHTQAGTAEAHRVLIRHSDLGGGWVTGATPKKVGSLACATVTLKGVVEIGSAVSPTYRRSGTGPFVSESAFTYNSSAGAATFFKRVATRGALSCLAQTILQGASSSGVSFTVVAKQALPAPRVPAKAAAYRIVGRAQVQAQKIDVYIDLVLLQQGNAIAELGFSSFAVPVSRADELQITRAAAKRL